MERFIEAMTGLLSVAVYGGIAVFAVVAVLGVIAIFYGLMVFGSYNRAALRGGSVLSPHTHPSYSPEKSYALQKAAFARDNEIASANEKFAEVANSH